MKRNYLTLAASLVLALAFAACNNNAEPAQPAEPRKYPKDRH